MTATIQSDVSNVPTAALVYTPPAATQQAKSILVKPNLGYPVGPPATVSMAVLGKVLTGLRQASPNAEILIVEGVCSKVPFAYIMGKLGVYDLLDEGMQLWDADTLERACSYGMPTRWSWWNIPTKLQTPCDSKRCGHQSCCKRWTVASQWALLRKRR